MYAQLTPVLEMPNPNLYPLFAEDDFPIKRPGGLFRSGPEHVDPQRLRTDQASSGATFRAVFVPIKLPPSLVNTQPVSER